MTLEIVISYSIKILILLWITLFLSEIALKTNTYLGWAISYFFASLKNSEVHNACLPGVHVKLIMKVWLLNGHPAAFHILLIHNGINTVYGQDTQSGALDKVPRENRAPNV